MSSKKAAALPKKPAVPAKAPIPIAPPSAEKQPSYRVMAMQVENIKRIAFVRLRPKGNVVTISGGNGEGKTSLLDSISWGLTGERQLPSQPIRKGQGAAKISIDIGNGLRVERTFTRINGGKEPFLTRLAVYGSNREAYPTPQTVLDKLRTVISFDPLRFIQMPPDKQLETLRKMLVFDIDLEALELEKKQAYDERREAGKEEAAATARLKAMPAPPADLPEKPINVQTISKKLADAGTANNARMEALQKRTRLEDEAQRHRDHVAEMQAAAAHLRSQADALDLRIKEENQKGLDCDEQSDAVKVPDEIETKTVLEELNKANATNLNIQKAAQYRSTEGEIKAAVDKWTKLDETFKKLDADRTAAIERAKMPIEKLGIGDGEVLYDGLPFSQASNGEQIRIAVALSMASNPQLRILLIRDGSLLDRKSEGMIEQMAAENDFQVWIERVESAGKVGIVMEDGEASGDEVEQVVR